MLWWALVKESVLVGIFFERVHAKNSGPCSARTTLDKRKEPSPRFAVRRTLFHCVISWSMTHDQRRAKSSATDRQLVLALILRHRAWFHMMEERSSRRESRGLFFLFLSRVAGETHGNTLPPPWCFETPWRSQTRILPCAPFLIMVVKKGSAVFLGETVLNSCRTKSDGKYNFLQFHFSKALLRIFRLRSLTNSHGTKA